ncbi:ParM/StbA family protein [Clostridium haemolyticum]|uniref:Actin-like protein N-terminal domain-containing protein n=1 Tax=Clostridium haemolyticum NCTC 9693 TaxID=1443114 RepID=A0ABR4TI94_CLOHA|nr:ParM/StbA family protein [Clostridium haemolyticum]KEI18232.1 hypothetical protein Z960_03655 [Clostridium haemolyticum NCTC 9693]KGN03869.1 hypothetical protein Z961_06080 [Clostridium haemolyticum NCTC 8350]
MGIEKEIQIIGLDIGRGYVKGYSEINEMKKEVLFKSIISEGRSLNFDEFENPIYVEAVGEKYFAGLLAEKEGYTPIRNSKDSKVSDTVEKLVYAALNSLAVKEKVSIMFGVPYKLFKKSTLEEVVSKYSNKNIKIKDNITGAYKNITICNVSIFREADAAAMWEVRNNMENAKPIGIANIGFRTTELSYFDKGLRFNDKYSKTIELGNRTALKMIQDHLESNNIMKELQEIDSSDDYENLKRKAYKVLSERVSQDIEDNWINLDEMEILIAGGTAKHMKFDEGFRIIDEPQMATAKGLYLVGTRVFK